MSLITATSQRHRHRHRHQHRATATSPQHHPQPAVRAMRSSLLHPPAAHATHRRLQATPLGTTVSHPPTPPVPVTCQILQAGTKRYKSTLDATTNRIKSLLFKVRSLRMSGSCALNVCGIAAGRLDLFFELGFGGPWDVAAGALIVTEAGGLVFDPPIRHLWQQNSRYLREKTLVMLSA